MNGSMIKSIHIVRIKSTDPVVGVISISEIVILFMSSVCVIPGLL